MPTLRTCDLPFLATTGGGEDLCAVELTVDGGGDNFSCYLPDEDVVESGQVLNKGSDLSGSWDFEQGVFGIRGTDSYASYTPGDKVGVGGLNGGFGFGGTSWVFANGAFGVNGLDTFSSYTPGDKVGVGGLNGGSGYTGDWVFANG